MGMKRMFFLKKKRFKMAESKVFQDCQFSKKNYRNLSLENVIFHFCAWRNFCIWKKAQDFMENPSFLLAFILEKKSVIIFNFHACRNAQNIMENPSFLLEFILGKCIVIFHLNAWRNSQNSWKNPVFHWYLALTNVS